MIEGIFNTLYEAMMGSAWIAVLASVGWGVLSILLSQCHLSSIPLIVGFISSQGKMSVGRTFNFSLVFSLGILFTIGLIGVITASLGRLMGDLGSFGNYFVAVIFFIVGLYLLDIIKFDWNNSALKQTKTKGLLATLILGLLFGLALGPCTFAYMAPAEVDEIIRDLKAKGVKIAKEPQKVFWGGYSSYFVDPDCYHWEVAHNPFFAFDESGNLKLE